MDHIDQEEPTTSVETPSAIRLLEQARMLLAQNLEAQCKVQATQIEVLEAQNKNRMMLAESIRLIETVQRELSTGIDSRVDAKLVPIRKDVELLKFRIKELEERSA